MNIADIFQGFLNKSSAPYVEFAVYESSGDPQIRCAAGESCLFPSGLMEQAPNPRTKKFTHYCADCQYPAHGMCGDETSTHNIVCFPCKKAKDELAQKKNNFKNAKRKAEASEAGNTKRSKPMTASVKTAQASSSKEDIQGESSSKTPLQASSSESTPGNSSACESSTSSSTQRVSSSSSTKRELTKDDLLQMIIRMRSLFMIDKTSVDDRLSKLENKEPAKQISPEARKELKLSASQMSFAPRATVDDLYVERPTTDADDSGAGKKDLINAMEESQGTATRAYRKYLNGNLKALKDGILKELDFVNVALRKIYCL